MSGRAAIRRNGTTPAWADEEVVTQRTERDATTEDVPAPPPVDEGGAVTVSARVVADIVARAVGEVRGVHGLVPRGEDPLLAWLRRLAGRDGDVPGVAVRVGGREVRVGLAVAVAYGASIPVVVDALRRYVTARVETLTGLAVREVRVDVRELAFPEGGPPAVDG